MLEEILALLVGAIVEGCLKGHRLGLALGQVYLLDAALATQIEELELAVGLHAAAATAFQHNLGLVFQQVVLPQVVVVFELGLIVECVALRTEHGIAQVTAVDSEAHDAVLGVLQVEGQQGLGGVFGFSGFS